MDFEKKLGRLEQIVEKMEDGDISLDDSLKMFEEGVKLSSECQAQLSQAEQKVNLLLKVDQSGNAETKSFEIND